MKRTSRLSYSLVTEEASGPKRFTSPDPAKSTAYIRHDSDLLNRLLNCKLSAVLTMPSPLIPDFRGAVRCDIFLPILVNDT
jgi:hypothetical protein